MHGLPIFGPLFQSQKKILGRFGKAARFEFLVASYVGDVIGVTVHREDPVGGYSTPAFKRGDPAGAFVIISRRRRPAIPAARLKAQKTAYQSPLC